MAEQEDPHLLSWTSPNYNNIQKRFFSGFIDEKTRTHQKRSSTNKDIKKKPRRWVGGWSKVPHSHISTAQRQENYNCRDCLKKWVFWAPHWAPQPDGPAIGKMNPGMFGFEGQRGLLSAAPGAEEIGNSTHEEDIQNLTCSVPSICAISFERSLGQTYLLISKSLPERSEAPGAHPGTINTGRSHFGEFVLPHGHWCRCKCHFGIFPLAYN